jgi:hypothetical protein
VEKREEKGGEPGHIPAVFLARVAAAKPREIPQRHAISGNKKPALRAGSCLSIGGAEEDRTPDLRIANATLSQLSYRPTQSREA